MKEIIGNKIVTNAPLSNFITVKNREIFDKKEIPETFNNCFVKIGPSLFVPMTFQHYIHNDVSCLSTIEYIFDP